jgi:uncharacterized protein (UPF0276 family)
VAGWRSLGSGVGLRPTHYERVSSERPAVDWFEVISENFFAAGGNARRVLYVVRRDYPIVLHGVSMSVGSVDPVDERHLRSLQELVEQYEPAMVSDHLCWGRHGGRYAHDLWPLPYTEEALAHVVERVARIQERLGRRILLENVSTYVQFTDSEMTEQAFLAAVAERADCGILLDVNNVYVSSVNHGFDAERYIDEIPVERVAQIHLAGHSEFETHLLDTHDHPVPDAVWALYRRALRRFGPVSTLVEWDDRIPALEMLLAEADKARAEMHACA